VFYICMIRNSLSVDAPALPGQLIFNFKPSARFSKAKYHTLWISECIVYILHLVKQITHPFRVIKTHGLFTHILTNKHCVQVCHLIVIISKCFTMSELSSRRCLTSAELFSCTVTLTAFISQHTVIETILLYNIVPQMW